MSLWAVGTAGLPWPGKAGGVLTPYAAEDIEHNRTFSTYPRAAARRSGKWVDLCRYFSTRVPASRHVSLDEQKFFGTGEFRHFNYDNFTALNHNEELFDGGLKWKLGAHRPTVCSSIAMNSAVSSFRIWRRHPTDTRDGEQRNRAPST